MNSTNFDTLLDGIHAQVDNTLRNKAAEYAADDDRLHNFKKAAGMLGCTPRQALMGMLSKHTTSIYDMGTSTDVYSAAMWDEKIIDHINYLILLRAIVTEEALQEKSDVFAQNVEAFTQAIEKR